MTILYYRCQSTRNDWCVTSVEQCYSAARDDYDQSPRKTGRVRAALMQTQLFDFLCRLLSLKSQETSEKECALQCGWKDSENLLFWIIPPFLPSRFFLSLLRLFPALVIRGGRGIWRRSSGEREREISWEGGDCGDWGIKSDERRGRRDDDGRDAAPPRIGAAHQLVGVGHDAAATSGTDEKL